MVNCNQKYSFLDFVHCLVFRKEHNSLEKGISSYPQVERCLLSWISQKELLSITVICVTVIRFCLRERRKSHKNCGHAPASELDRHLIFGMKRIKLIIRFEFHVLCLTLYFVCNVNCLLFQFIYQSHQPSQFHVV